MRYLLVTLCLLFSWPQVSWSADTGPAVKEDAELQQARTQIAKKDWSAAVSGLESYTRSNTSSADGFNLLGYSYRNLQRYDESLVAYKKALAIDPKHRGAHEYIGIAYLQMGQLPNAKTHLDALDKICLFSCEEYRDLKKAYEAALKSGKN